MPRLSGQEPYYSHLRRLGVLDNVEAMVTVVRKLSTHSFHHKPQTKQY